jgi:predicted outer membrane repeat protein
MAPARSFIGWNPRLGLGMWIALACAGCADEPFDEGDGEGLAGFRSGPVDGLELHWTFEDRIGNQVLDISGKGRHGWLQGGGSFVASANGEAVSLDGLDDYLAFVGPRDPAIYGGIDGNFTINARVKVPNVARYNTLCFGCGPFSTMYVGTEIYGARTMSAVLDKSNSGSLWPWSTQSLTNDTWVEVTMVVDGGVAARTYLDCELDSTLVNANLGLKNFGFSSVGRGAVASRWYQGEIDDLRIWNRALTDAEITTICPAPAGLCDGPIHVDIDAPAEGDGLTWASAFNNLQAALDASLECADPQLWVAEGTYAPNPNSPVATIGSAPVAIYGGFAGDEDALEQRDVAAHVTRLGADDWNARVVLVQASAASAVDEVRLDGFTIADSNVGAIHLSGAFSATPPITATFENLEITNNVSASLGAGILAHGRAAVEVVGSRFTGNSGLQGSGIHFQGGTEQSVQAGTLSVTDCEFVGNHGKSGGAIYITNTGGGNELVSIIDSTFTDNTATWGGAISLDDYPSTLNPIDLTIDGCEFTNNSAVQGGGAILSEETLTSIHASVFEGNTAGFGGAIHVDNIHAVTELPGWEIRDCRFIGNQATSTGGGALLLEEHEVTIVNTEFAGNSAVGGGGGIFGRATVVASTFTGNTGSIGSGVYAPPGPLVAMRHIVAWPDKVVGNDIMLDYSCVAPTVNDDTIAPYVTLAGDPFDPADLDVDGRTEHYLASDSPCRDFAGISAELDWAGLTTQISQCTDVAPTDAGVHYVPIFPAGECMGGGGDGDGDTDSSSDDGGSTSTTDDGGSTSTSTTDDGGSTSTTDDGGSTSTTGDGDGDTTGDGDGDGDCSEWTSTKTRALGLDKVWTDGFDIIATGKGDLVKLADGQWQDIEATTADRWMTDVADVWGPAVDDHWLLGFVQMKYGWGVFHHNGTEIDGHRLFPYPVQNMFGLTIPIDIAGSGPNDIWATATSDCDTWACSEDPDCACNWAPSMLMHYDGVEWTDMPSPGHVTRIWTDGTKVWGVGGRNVDESPWLNPVPGVLASFNGSFWTVVGELLPPLTAVWSNDGDLVWVGGDEGTLRSFDGLEWEVHDLPTTATIVRIEGRSSSEIWALDDVGELWAYDGVAWNEWLSLPHIHDFSVMDDQLVLVGDADGNIVEFVDIENETVDTVYLRRGDFYPATMVADDLHSAVATSGGHTAVGGVATDGSWRWDGATWSPTYVDFSPGFDKLVGDVDQGFGTRYLLKNEVDPDFHPVYEILDGEIVEIAPPAADLRVTNSALFNIGGQDQLWVATATMDFLNPQYRLYARVDGAWVDRQPPGLTQQANMMTQGAQRVFVNFNGPSNANMTWMFEAGVWTNISNPLDNGRALSLASTGKFQLWMTVSSGQTSPNPEQLYFWGGAGWNIAKNLFPEIAGHDQWWTLSARAPNDMWMVSSRSFEAESFAHWDGQGWTLIDTPVHGWGERQYILLEPTPDGVFIHDGVRLWRYEADACVP